MGGRYFQILHMCKKETENDSVKILIYYNIRNSSQNYIYVKGRVTKFWSLQIPINDNFNKVDFTFFDSGELLTEPQLVMLEVLPIVP